MNYFENVGNHIETLGDAYLSKNKADVRTKVHTSAFLRSCV